LRKDLLHELKQITRIKAIPAKRERPT